MRYLENPLRVAPMIRNSAWRSLGLGALATAIAVAVGLGLFKVIPPAVGHGAPALAVNFNSVAVPAGSDMAARDAAVQQTFAQVQAALAASNALRAVPSNLTPPLDHLAAEEVDFTYNGCLRTPYETGQPSNCVMGDTASADAVALVGDSHGAMWTPAFVELANQRHWRLTMLAKEACPIMDVKVDGHLREFIDRFQHCDEWRDEIMARLKADHPRLVVVSPWRGYGIDETMTTFKAFNPAWIDSMTRLVHELRAIGTQVLVLGPIPDPHGNVPLCVSGHLDDVTACSLPRSTSVNTSGIAAEAAAVQAGGGQYADITDLFCTAQTCPVIVGNTLVYLDVSHLTLQYSRVLAPAIGSLVDRALARR
jgi:hypothetical protein